MNTKRLLFWNGKIDEALEEQIRLNGYDPKFLELQDHFMMNIDKASMVVSNGNLHVVGSTDTLKHEKSIDDNQDII